MPGERPQSPERESENLKVPTKPGAAPRPATEPKGGEGSARNSKTKTDPATGEPTR
jgi:hypothetical protein